MKKYFINRKYILIIVLIVLILPFLAFITLVAARLITSQPSTQSIFSFIKDNKITPDIAQELKDCLPKSDMASKSKCEELLKKIENYKDCVDAGFPVIDTIPSKCETVDGRVFINDQGNSSSGGCRSDGKLCPDGSTVGRVPPNCEFVPCSSSTPSGRQTSLVGEYVCLPHKNTQGPQTLECALGIKTDEGQYFALDLQAVGYEAISKIGTGNKMRVEGSVIYIDELNSNQWEKYNIKGTIRVSQLTKL